MRILCVISGHYGRRIFQHLEATVPEGWEVRAWEGPASLPPIIDEPEAFLPDELPEADLLLSLAENAGLSDLVADLAGLAGAQAVIAPIDRWSWLPPGLAKQLARRLQRRGLGYAFPSPFCALQPLRTSHPLINTFAQRYGGAQVRCTLNDGHIAAVEIEREAPCGNTRFVAARLIGQPAEDAAEKAGLFHHYYPCLAVMDQASTHSHTLLHQAAKITSTAVASALARLDRTGIIEKE